MKIWQQFTQGTEEWFLARAGRPTASNFHKIITPTGKLSAQIDDYVSELIADCIRPDMMATGDTEKFMGNKHTDRGAELEPDARECFETSMDFTVTEVGFVTRDDEIIGCSPDGLIFENGRAIAGLEIKCPLSKNHVAYWRANELPSQYRQQVHGSMAVTGLRRWYFMSYSERMMPLILEIHWDEYTDKVLSALDQFQEYYLAEKAKILPKIRL